MTGKPQLKYHTVESAIGARRIRSILKSGMCSLTTFLHGFFCFDDGSEQQWPSGIRSVGSSGRGVGVAVARQRVPHHNIENKDETPLKGIWVQLPNYNLGFSPQNTHGVVGSCPNTIPRLGSDPIW